MALFGYWLGALLQARLYITPEPGRKVRIKHPASIRPCSRTTIGTRVGHCTILSAMPDRQLCPIQPLFPRLFVLLLLIWELTTQQARGSALRTLTDPTDFVLLYDDLADSEARRSAASLGCKLILNVYQSDDPKSKSRGVMDPVVIVEAISRQAAYGLPEYGMLDFEDPFFDVLAEGPSSPRFSSTVETMVNAIRVVKAAFPKTKWSYYGMPQLPYWIGEKRDKEWLNASTELKRFHLTRAIEIYRPLIEELDWISPSIYCNYDPAFVKWQPETATRAQNRAWVKASVGISKLLARGKPVIPTVCPWWAPAGSAPYCRVVPRRLFIEDTVIPAVEAGAQGLSFWTAMSYQIRRVTAADPSTFGHERNFGTPEWRKAVVADYFEGTPPADWTDPAVTRRLVSRMSSAVVTRLRDVRNWVGGKQVPP